MKQTPTTERVFSIFKELNAIPRPSHHEERVADYLCQFAERLHLSYDRDEHNCVVIRKPATPGHESAEPIVLLNHMDMVCVGMSDPLNSPIEAYVDNGWMKARGTSLGADNGIGLSMALAVLEDDSIVHGPLEVMTTTNEEDGMSGASNLALDFIRGRKVINLDSEDYDTITTGAAGAYMQEHRLPILWVPAPAEAHRWYRIAFAGGLGGHSGVDINKNRISATVATRMLLCALLEKEDVFVGTIRVGEANASIASSAEIVVCAAEGSTSIYVEQQQGVINKWLKENFSETDPKMECAICACDSMPQVISRNTIASLLACLKDIPQGVVKMSEAMEGTVETSNNVGRILVEGNKLLTTTHTRSFIDADMVELGKRIAAIFCQQGASSKVVMEAPAWQENQHSDFLCMTSDVFQDMLGWRPRMVAMHFVLEAGFFAQKFPGIQMASIGPRIVEPHSTSERVELKTIDDIWVVLIEMLRRLA